jgi:molybdopterin/thiamine biosynthesis adenylyltransferase
MALCSITPCKSFFFFSENDVSTPRAVAAKRRAESLAAQDKAQTHEPRTLAARG